MSEEQEIQKRERTLGEKFVDRFPSQIDDDPELKSKQERNVQWLIYPDSIEIYQQENKCR